MLVKKNYGTEHYLIQSNDRFPNNKKLPVLLYKSILHLPFIMPGQRIVALFKKNGWYNSWKAGIYTYHHYHSTTHEVLGFYKGKATLLLGGDNGVQVNVAKGDVLIIPAGVAHKNLGDENDTAAIGAYPDGKSYDMNYGYVGERPQTDKNIEAIPLPKKDPVLGVIGEMRKYWGNV